MAAELILCGDPAVGVGGEFERECARILRNELPVGYVVATNVHFPRKGNGFYECDAIIAAPGTCDILEMKCIRPDVFVGEDVITSSTGFCIDRVLSILDHKAKVIASRREQRPFPSGVLHRQVRVNSQVVVPSDARITFRFAPYSMSKPVRTLADTVEKYRQIAAASPCFRDATARQEVRNAWKAYRDSSARSQRHSPQYLGRFSIRRILASEPAVFEYFAVDEPPCQMEVQLREFPFDPALPSKELGKYLQEVARETRTLMKVRHPYVSCVVGHFQTGGSWVQVSDWFEGEKLDALWSVMADMSNFEKIGIFIKTIQALEFCHEKGVFHRNLSARSIVVSPDFSEVKLTGFDFALDLGGTSPATSGSLARRDPRLIAPEDLQTGRSSNPRLSDIFQAGVLLYRLLEQGEWPFPDTIEHVTSGGQLRPFTMGEGNPETAALRLLAMRMMDVAPARRPDLLGRVEEELASILAGSNR